MSKRKLRIGDSNSSTDDDYLDFYDDSSDEEDYSIAIEDDTLDRIESIFDINSKRSFQEELTIGNLDTQLSVFLHDMGTRLIQSKEVNDIYYPLKRQLLKADNVLDDGQICTILDDSFKSTIATL